MLLSLLATTLLTSAPSLPSPQCLTANGRTVCGYSCRASSSGIGCASTPYGTCAQFHGEVHCFDPSATAVHHPPNEGLNPQCKSAGGESACGFNCLVASGRAACARTPYGVCREHHGVVKCWDPPEATIHEYGSELPRPTCLAVFSAMACGYDCKADRSEVKCASTPRGRCEKQGSQIECFDPPVLAHCAHSRQPDPEEVRKPRSQRQE